MDDSDIDTLLARLAATPRRHAPLRMEHGTERYELLRHLGRGGFGDVYEARDREHGTRVALKRLKSSDPAWLHRFKREFRVVADLSHPNIVRLYELFSEKEQWYLTMELVAGRPFGEHVARAPESLRSCFSQLALAIDALHRSGCLHRDIKPSNALVEPTGRVVLLDFGLAVRSFGALHTALGGTPPYMAPELGLRTEPAEASDWYSFGVMLYEALAGALPYDGSESEILQAKVNGPPRPLGRPGGDPELEALALQLLSPAPTDRPRSEEILARLAPARPAPRFETVETGDLTVVGRDREIARLADALERSRQGAVVVTLHGLPGMGKSTLAHKFGHAALVCGARFFEGRCLESEALPFKGLDGVVDMLCEDLLGRPDEEVARLRPAGAPALVQMFPVLKRVRELGKARDARLLGPHATRNVARAALRELLARMAGTDRVVLFLDDVQWANDDSVRMLLDLLAPPAPPILVLLAHRREARGAPGPLSALLEALDARPSLARLDLPVEPLDRDGVVQLLALRPECGVDPDRAIRETGGHPYLLSRLLGAGGWTEAERPDLAAILGAQIETLGPDARRLLEVVSVSASALSQRSAFAIAGQAWTPVVADALRREKLVQCSAAGPDGLIEPYHARVRDTVLAALSPERRRELHLLIASYLETRGRAEPETLAYHHLHAGQHALALKWTLRAARSARDAFAFARAAELYRDAVALAESDHQRIELTVELAEARVQAGHRAEAGRTYLAAAELAAARGDDRLVSAMRTRAGEHFLLAGHIKDGIRLLGDALAAVGLTLPADAPAAVAATLEVGARLMSRGLAFSPRAEDAVPPRDLRRLDLELAVSRALTLIDARSAWVGTQALLDAVEVGEPHRVQRAMASFAFSVCARAPNHPLVVECVAGSRRLADELDDDYGRAWASLVAGMWRAQRAEFPAAVEELRDAQRRFLARGHEDAREAAIAHIVLLVLLGNYGIDLPTAQREYPRCLEDALGRDDLFAANWTRMQLSWSSLAGGDVAAARECMRVVRQSWPGADEDLFAGTALVNEIAIELYEQPANAWATVDRLRPVFDALQASQIPVTRGLFHRLGASSALAAFVAGNATREQTLERIAPAYAAASGWEYGGPMTRAVEAFLRLAEDDREGYARLLAAAEEGWREQAQRGPMLAARLRRHQLRGEAEAAEAVGVELRAFGVADPDRYALLFAGPRAA